MSKEWSILLKKRQKATNRNLKRNVYLRASGTINLNLTLNSFDLISFV